MDKFERWRETFDEYFKTVTDEQLIEDSRRVGIEVFKKPQLSERVPGRGSTRPIDRVVPGSSLAQVTAKARKHGYVLRNIHTGKLGFTGVTAESTSAFTGSRKESQNTTRRTKPKRKPTVQS